MTATDTKLCLSLNLLTSTYSSQILSTLVSGTVSEALKKIPCFIFHYGYFRAASRKEGATGLRSTAFSRMLDSFSSSLLLWTDLISRLFESKMGEDSLEMTMKYPKNILRRGLK